MGEEVDQVTLSQLKVGQGEGIPPVVFERYFDQGSSEAWRKKIREKIRQFGIEIKLRTGYDFLLRREKSFDGIDIFSVDVVAARQRHVFIVNDFMVEYQIHKEV